MEGGGGGGGDLRRTGVERREQHHQKPFLPLDIVLEIAARTDPVTLVRCAATCRDARRRVADDQFFHCRLRLRHSTDGRFVPSLLRDHLVVLDRYKNGNCLTGVEVHLVDATAAPGTGARSRPLSSAEGFPPHPDGGKSILWHKPLGWRDGLFLVRTTDRPRGRRDELRVCDPATGHSHTLPPEPTFHGDAEKRRLSRWAAMVAEKRWQPYVLLGGDGEVVDGDASGIIGRPFQVLKANLVMSEHHRYLETQTFSSESGTWGTYAKLRAPHFHGSSLLQRDGGRPLVAGGAVHWLCVTDAASYVLRLHVRTAQVTVTTLPAIFPRPNNDYRTWASVHYLLATATAGGSLMVLVADREKISAWVQTATKTTTAKWKPRPEVVVEYEAFLRFRSIAFSGTFSIQLHWFAERSGFVLVYAGVQYGFFLLDLRSKKIARWFSGRRLNSRFGFDIFAPYEMDLSSWAPTFTSPF